MRHLRRTHAVPALPAAALLLLLASGCTGDEEQADASPGDVLAAARTTLDETSGVRLHLSTDDLPPGVAGITAASGVVTHAPAFDGTISVIFAGTAVEVPVVAVGDEVYAQIPLTVGWSRIDPAEYGAPNPARLITPGSGFTSLLPATTSVTRGESVRGGADNDEILTAYTGTVPGSAMKKVIPSSAGDSFDAEYQITDDDQLRSASFTGVFYPDSAEMTYEVDFDEYGVQQEITAPEVSPSGTAG
jgi:lipoprotein LprG